MKVEFQNLKTTKGTRNNFAGRNQCSEVDIYELLPNAYKVLKKNLPSYVFEDFLRLAKQDLINFANQPNY